MFEISEMGTVQLTSYAAFSSFSTSFNINYITNYSHKTLKTSKRPPIIRAVGTIPGGESQAIEAEEPPSVAFAFVSVSLNNK